MKATKTQSAQKLGVRLRGPATAGGSSTVDDMLSRLSGQRKQSKALNIFIPCIPSPSHLISSETVAMGVGASVCVWAPGTWNRVLTHILYLCYDLLPYCSLQPTAYRRVHRWHPHARPKPHGRARPPAARRACWLHLAEQKAELLAWQTPRLMIPVDCGSPASQGRHGRLPSKAGDAPKRMRDGPYGPHQKCEGWSARVGVRGCVTVGRRMDSGRAMDDEGGMGRLLQLPPQPVRAL